jgi:hypothetical protein
VWEKLVGGVLGLVTVAILGYVALDIFTFAVSSPAALEPGDPFYNAQHGFLPIVAGYFPYLIGGAGLVLTALAELLARGR